jgi:hypothetical protein
MANPPSNFQTNSQGLPLSTLFGRTSQQITNVVANNKMLSFPCNGNRFMLQASSAKLQIRPRNGSSTGAFQEYEAGTGLIIPVENGFDFIDIKNTSGNDAAFTLFVGYDDYIDNRLIVYNPNFKQVVYQTYENGTPSTDVSIPDLSGQAFLDLNGGKWYAVQRTAILIFNLSDATTYKVRGATAPNKIIGAVYPATTLRIDAAGNFKISDAANVDVIVSEIYSATPNPV